eukprot:6129181-Amphidinium_carterae.1
MCLVCGNTTTVVLLRIGALVELPFGEAGHSQRFSLCCRQYTTAFKSPDWSQRSAVSSALLLLTC